MRFVNAGSFRLTVRELESAVSPAAPANESRTHFLAAAGHDLRQPLQTLGILADILRRRVSDPDLRALVDRQDASLWSMRALLECFLDLNRIESGAIAPAPRDFELREVLNGLDETLREQAARRGARLDIVSSSLAAHSDPALVGRIAETLVANAIEYAGARRVTAGCRRSAARLRLEIWDTGDAVAPARRAATLREERAGRGEAPGYGLGLILVRRLADMIGAGLEVRAAPGGATMVGIVLTRA